MKALVFQGPGKRAWEDKPKPSLKTAADAILRITKTSVNERDLSAINEDIHNVPAGLILGHEGAGIIDEIGSDVRMFKIGDKVMVSHTSPCEKGESCKQGLHVTCDEGACSLGRQIDGTLAEYTRIPNADLSLHHIPDGVDEGTLMMLKDILPTGFEYSVPNGQIQPGNTVVIFGTGHIGLTALLLSQFHSPADIIMVDTNRYRLEASTDLGATKLVHSIGGNALEDIMIHTGGKSVDVAIVANAKVALNSMWKSYGQAKLPFQRVLLMPSWRHSMTGGSVAKPPSRQGIIQLNSDGLQANGKHPLIMD